MWCLTKNLEIIKGQYNKEQTRFYWDGFRGACTDRSNIIMVSESKEVLEDLKEYNLRTMSK